MRSSRRGLVWVLLALLALLIFIAVAVGIVLALLRQQQSTPDRWQDPVVSLSPDAIAPDLALYPLAGASQLETIDAALANGDLETAYGTLVFSPDLADRQRIGRLIALGRQAVDAGQVDRASLSYQQVYDAAVLSPDLNDPTRADALLASGRGWARLGQTQRAQDAYNQVYLIALHSPYLQMGQRRHLLAELETVYLDMGDTAQSQEVRNRIIELDQEPGPQPPAAPAVSPDLVIGESQISSPEVGTMEENRRQAAYSLLQALPDGAEPPESLVQALAEALKAEDQAKLSFYEQELAGTTQLGRRVDLHWQVIRWLTLKYQVASGGLGLTLVPEWEGQVTEIQSVLSKAYEDLFFDYEDMVASLPEASLVAPGSYAARRGIVLAGRLGQYPNYPAQQLTAKMQEAAEALIAAGIVDPLFVDAALDGEDLYFFLSSAGDYGQRGQAGADAAP